MDSKFKNTFFGVPVWLRKVPSDSKCLSSSQARHPMCFWPHKNPNQNSNVSAWLWELLFVCNNHDCGAAPGSRPKRNLDSDVIGILKEDKLTL